MEPTKRRRSTLIQRRRFPNLPNTASYRQGRQREDTDSATSNRVCVQWLQDCDSRTSDRWLQEDCAEESIFYVSHRWPSSWTDKRTVNQEPIIPLFYNMSSVHDPINIINDGHDLREVRSAAERMSLEDIDFYSESINKPARVTCVPSEKYSTCHVGAHEKEAGKVNEYSGWLYKACVIAEMHSKAINFGLNIATNSDGVTPVFEAAQSSTFNQDLRDDGNQNYGDEAVSQDLREDGNQNYGDESVQSSSFSQDLRDDGNQNYGDESVQSSSFSQDLRDDGNQNYSDESVQSSSFSQDLRDDGNQDNGEISSLGFIPLFDINREFIISSRR